MSQIKSTKRPNRRNGFCDKCGKCKKLAVVKGERDLRAGCRSR